MCLSRARVEGEGREVQSSQLGLGGGGPAHKVTLAHAEQAGALELGEFKGQCTLLTNQECDGKLRPPAFPQGPLTSQEDLAVLQGVSSETFLRKTRYCMHWT